MANALYQLGRGHFLDGNIDWTANDIVFSFMDTDDYTVNLDTHEDQVDLTDLGIIATSAAMAGKSSTFGVADAADTTIATVAGDQFEAIVIYYDSGVDATSLLIAYIDTATGLPCTPNGGDITVQWDAGASKIFKL